MGKVHINSEKQNRKKIKSENVLQLNPISLIGPGVIEIQESTPEALPIEVIKEIIKEVPIEVIKTIEVPKVEYIEKIIEVIKEVPKIEYVEKEVIREVLTTVDGIIEVREPEDYQKLKKENKLLKILVPILAVVAAIGLII